MITQTYDLNFFNFFQHNAYHIPVIQSRLRGWGSDRQGISAIIVSNVLGVSFAQNRKNIPGTNNRYPVY